MLTAAPAGKRARPLKARDPSAAHLARAAMLPALFDVNVLIALLDADHLHHHRASRWLSDHIGAGWASCAATQNGCLRVMSQPGYPNPLPVAQVADRLLAATQTKHHRFIAEAPSLLDDRHFDTGQLLGHRQVSDAWLLGLAVQNGLRFVTFDGAIPLRVVRGASAEQLVTL